MTVSAHLVSSNQCKEVRQSEDRESEEKTVRRTIYAYVGRAIELCAIAHVHDV